MEWSEFNLRFGRALRTKNILKRRPNPRHFEMQKAEPEIPREFIRLCPWEAEYIFAVARRAKRGVVEIGRFNGGSLFLMACALRGAVPITSVDLEPQNDALLSELLQQHHPEADIRLIIGDSQHTAYPDVEAADVIFIDGDHTYEGCMADIRNWYPKLLPGGHLLFHDSYLGDHGVQDAILDFMDEHPELQILKSPVIGATYWHYPAGSVSHLIRRPT